MSPWMNSLLLNRSANLGHKHELQRFYNHRLLRALQPSDTRFEKARRNAPSSSSQILNDLGALSIAHHGGVNAITIDKFEGK
jgi:hypothetical protein